MTRLFSMLIAVLFLVVGHTASAQDGILLKRAQDGDAEAQISLGADYHYGDGVEQDYVEALKWFRLAAEQGYAAAQFNLGVFYYSGEGIEQDYVEALKWFRLAAEQGIADAQYNLGVVYYDGDGVPLKKWSIF